MTTTALMHRLSAIEDRLSAGMTVDPNFPWHVEGRQTTVRLVKGKDCHWVKWCMNAARYEVTYAGGGKQPARKYYCRHDLPQWIARQVAGVRGNDHAS